MMRPDTGQPAARTVIILASSDVIIVGAGPAGLSAALILGRSCRSVVVFDNGRQRNAITREMHGFLSCDGMAPVEFLRAARSDLGRYRSVSVVQATVAEVSRDGGGFSVRTEAGAPFRAQRLLLATGIDDILPDIPGLLEEWGQRVFVCPYCDAWELRGKRLAVIGRGRRAVGLAQELMRWSHDLVICSQKVNDLTEDDREWVRCVGLHLQEEGVASLHGSLHHALRLEFENGVTVDCDAAFLCTPALQRSTLPAMLGCEVDAGGALCVDANGETNVAGCYAAGDSVTRIHQVACAAASGVTAAIGINEALTNEEIAAVLRPPENAGGEL
ncbi:MAG: NAD(P)/FAD-dependent oxidoreductase [Candidatus Eremiobacteraeota bacterium]|nr:NAD(P)/FAD-dependent oxidoreductase [Candidatus Eremiobacteraeota bacterium]